MLAYAKKTYPDLYVKTSVMVGLGETLEGYSVHAKLS